MQLPEYIKGWPMFDGLPREFMLMLGGAFVLGWLVAIIGAFLSRRSKAVARDPRDDRIRSLEAEHRIARTNVEQGKEKISALDKELSEARASLAESQNTLSERADTIAVLRRDLRDSVKKTRELRLELTDRATESVRSEVRLREIETELEVTRASTDLIATGVLDYTMAPDSDDVDDEKKVVKASS